MSNLKYFLAGVLIMAITSCMQKDSELFLSDRMRVLQTLV